MTKRPHGFRALMTIAALCASVLLPGGCGEQQEAAIEDAPAEVAAAPAPAKASNAPAPPPHAPLKTALPEFRPGKDADTVATPTLAIAPLAGAADRRLDYSELLRETFRYAAGATFEASGGGAVFSFETADAAFAKRSLTPDQSVSGEVLLDIARELDIPLLLSWEPFQGADGRPILRLRLVSSSAGKIVFNEEIASPSATALPITCLDLFASAWPAAADACLKSQSGGGALLAADQATTPTRQFASSMGDLIFGSHMAERRKDILERAGDAEGWAYLARDCSRIAAALESPSRFKRQMSAAALAAALAGRNLSSSNRGVLKALGFAYWANGLNGRALAALQAAAQGGELDGEAASLLSLIAGDIETQEETPAAGRSPFSGCLGARQLRDFWMNDEAFALLHETSTDRWAADSPMLAASLDRKEPADASIAQAVFRSSLMLFRAGALCAHESGIDLSPYLKRLQAIDVELCAFAAADWGDNPAPPSRGIEERLGIDFSLQDFLAGKGALAELMKLACETGNLTDAPSGRSGSPLSWTNADRLAFTQAQCADAWLCAWRGANLERKDESAAGQALSLAEEIFPDSAAILTAKAQFYHTTGLDSAKRNEAIVSALAIDSAYVPAAVLSVETRQAGMAPNDAARLFESLRACDPFNAGLSCFIASNLARLGDLPRARGVYESARAIDPRNPAPYLGLLEIFSRREARTVTGDMISDLLSAYPKTPGLRLEAARLYFENGDPERGAGFASSLAQRHSGRFAPVALAARINAYLGRKAEIKDGLEAFLASDPANLKAATLLGSLLLARGDYGEAEEVYADAVAFAPDAASVWNGWAEAARGAKRQDEAIGRFQMIRELGFPGPAALSTGTILIEQGELDRALALAKNTQENSKWAAGGFELEARVRIAQGDAEAAANAMAEFVKEYPGNPHGLLAQSKILKTLGQFDESAKAAQAGLDLCNEQMEPPLRRAKAEALIEAKSLGKADEDLQLIKKIGFDDPDSLALLARAEIERNDLLRARSLLSVALRIAPRHARALSWRAIVEIKQGGKSKAAQWADEAREELVGIDAETLLNCAMVWKEAGDAAKSGDALELILKIQKAGPSADTAKVELGNL